MAKTKEGDVKNAVKDLLVEFGLIPAAKAPNVTEENTGWFFMPVSNGMGVHGIPDIIGHHFGYFFSIETKTEKKDPTPLQDHQINAINMTGAKNFVIRGVADVDQLRTWLNQVEKEAL